MADHDAETALPKPACKLGYTAEQVETVLAGRQSQFDRFMRGQTVAICQTTDGPGACRGGHGLVVYGCDWEANTTAAVLDDGDRADAALAAVRQVLGVDS